MAYTDLFSSEFPDFLAALSETGPLRRLEGVGMHCGCEYTRFAAYRGLKPYSRLTHSIGVGRIVWRFTHDPAQAAAGLLHDIATPAFAHVIDFLQGDYLAQESTEAHTADIIASSALIQRILSRLGLSTDQVSDYHLYPVADNDMPRLSADRLEYTLGNAHLVQGASLGEIAALYDDLRLATGEDGQPELAFSQPEAAEAFTRRALANGYWYVSDEDRFAMQALADLLRQALADGVLLPDDLYTTEPAVIAKLEGAPQTRAAWRAYRGLAALQHHDERPSGRYAVSIPAKKRYIDPLVLTTRGPRRVSSLSPAVAGEIRAFLQLRFDRWLSAAP